METFAHFVAIAQAEEKAGRRHSARIAFEQALQQVRTAEEGKQSTNVLRWIARLHHFEGNADAALDCLEAAIAVAEAWQDDAAVGNALNVRAVVRWQHGELDEAERLYLLARERAVRAGDAKLAAMTAQNLGVLANIRGDFRAAEEQYRASLAEYRSLGLTTDVCIALNNLGLLFIAQQQWDDAEEALLEGTRLCDTSGDVVARTQLDINLADLWVKRGDYSRASGAVRQALAAARQTGDASAIGRATRLLGVIARETGNFEEADRYFVEADEVATARGELLLQADIARDRADLARRTGRNRDVLLQLNRAHRLFGQLRAQHDLSDIDGRLGSLEQEFLHVARRWGESIEAKDRYTQGHCQRVAELACAIAMRGGFDERQLFWFRIGALLHDVGKLVIPPEVLNKPGKLDDEEWQLMKSHTTAGAEMLGDIEFPWDVRPMVQSHHERWDGKGYPHGLSGASIPLEARILTIADVYDALTSVRSYKRAHSHDDALAILRQDVGSMFDPEVFSWFEQVATDWPSRHPAFVPDTTSAARADEARDDTGEEEVDRVTSMPLRRTFREIGSRVLEARATTGRPVSMLIVDVDRLHLVNDLHGRAVGDRVLGMVADTVRRITRPSDHVARYAEDEFVVLLPGTRLEDASAVGERIRQAVSESVVASSDNARITVSIGAACTRTAGETLESLFGAADRALYEAKQSGRDTLAIASHGISDAAPMLRRCFVGRHHELQRLRGLIASCCAGSPHLMIIRGEAGSGKATLLEESATEMSVRGGATLVARCIESGVGNAYAPWADLVLAAHRAGLTQGGEWPELSRIVPELDTASARGGLVLHESGSQRALLLELEEFLRRCCANRPMLIVLQGLQWADAASLEALEFLLARMTDQRLAIGATVRLEDLSAEHQRRLRRLTRFERCSEVDVPRLSHEELMQWLTTMLDGQEVPGALLDHVSQQSEGNAFFVVQTLRQLVDDKRLTRTGDGWSFGLSNATSIPRAIDDLLSRRLEAFDSAQRDVLSHAAILGREFDSRALVASYEGDESIVHEALDNALANGVLTTATTSTHRVTLRFTHALLAQLLLDGVNPLRRQRIHARVARTIAAAPNCDIVSLVSHYDKAGLTADAYRTAIQAGNAALDVFASDNAADLFRIALRNASEPAQFAMAEWRLAQVEEGRGRFDAAEQHCRRVLTMHREGAGSAGIRGAAQCMELRLQLQRGVDAEEVVTACSEYLASSPNDPDPQDATALLIMLSALRQRLGYFEASEESAHRAVAAAERAGVPTLLADATNRLGSAIVERSPADAIPHYRKALDTFVQLGERVGQMKCHINLGSACDRAGNSPAAEASYQMAIAIGRDIRARNLVGVAMLNLGVLQLKGGKAEEARRHFDEACKLFTALGHEPYRLASIYNLGHLARHVQDPAGALELYEASIALAAALSQIDVFIGANAGAGLAQLDLHRMQQALRHLDEARTAIGERDDWWFQGRELYEALAIRVDWRRHGHVHAERLLLKVLQRVESHDVYAALWLAAECAGLLTRARPERERLLMRARALGYSPLVDRLSASHAPVLKVV